jgi:diguanylate cyclase (GGDEF)-like protein
MLFKSFRKYSIHLVALLAASVALSLLLGLSIRSLLIRLANSHMDRFLSLTYDFTIIICILLSIVFILLSIIINRITRERSHVKELKVFKSFSNTINQAPSEEAAYETLYKFILGTSLFDSVTLLYKCDKSEGTPEWKKLSDGKVSLCLFDPLRCPASNIGGECRVNNIKEGISCIFQLPQHKKGSYMCLPIMATKGLQSILQVYSQTECFFDEAVASKIGSYVDAARPVISSKITLDNLKHSASVDKLTSLYNRNFLETYLESQLEATKLSSQQLSLIMLDIDLFKNINDTYGHIAGDYVLSIFSTFVLKCIRKSDLAARYGGEEFVVVLPYTNANIAMIIAERIRHTVESTPFPPLDCLIIPQITCSLGVSTFPINCSNRDELIRTADLALYKAKQSGRNCTKIYDPSFSEDAGSVI